jgi:hypothetical protein
MPHTKAWVLIAALFPLVFATAPAPSVESVSAASSAVVQTLLNINVGSKLTISDFSLEGGPKPATLELDRFEVWSPGASVYLEDEELPRPTTRYFKGVVAGVKGSSVVLTVGADGQMGGLILQTGGSWAIENAGASISSRSADLSASRGPRSCGSDGLNLKSKRTSAHSAHAHARELQATTRGLRRLLAPISSNGNGGDDGTSSQSTAKYTISMAVDTDNALYKRFGNLQKATDYVGLLFAYTSLVFSREVILSSFMKLPYPRFHLKMCTPRCQGTSLPPSFPLGDEHGPNISPSTSTPAIFFLSRYLLRLRSPTSSCGQTSTISTPTRTLTPQTRRSTSSRPAGTPTSGASTAPWPICWGTASETGWPTWVGCALPSISLRPAGTMGFRGWPRQMLISSGMGGLGSTLRQSCGEL